MGFFEILVIAVLALLVVGPQRMPEAVRTVALTVGRFKRGLNSARAEIEKQIGADDIRQTLHNETIMANLDKVKSDVDEVNKAFEDSDKAFDDANKDSEEPSKPKPSEHLP